MHQWDRLAVPGCYTAFSNNKKMVTILKSSAHEVGGHVAEDQKQNL